MLTTYSALGHQKRRSPQPSDLSYPYESSTVCEKGVPFDTARIRVFGNAKRCHLMSARNSPPVSETLPLLLRETVIDGRSRHISCVEICGQIYTIIRTGPSGLVRLENEWYEDVREPGAIIDTLRRSKGIKGDIFTFWQRLPTLEPKYSYPIEWEELAVLPIKDYQHWWNHQIKSRVRNLIRKSEKQGLEVRETSFDDDFVRGMVTIFNEAPVRQGKPFFHYGKDFETVKRQFSRYLFREDMIGAYYHGELIGFVMLGNAGVFGITGQIISSLKHRDKATSNALIAKSVELCEKKGMTYLVYLHWADDSLAEFKRRCGFERTRAPRYYVALTPLGRLSLMAGVHRGWGQALPKQIRGSLKRLRRALYGQPEE